MSLVSLVTGAGSGIGAAVVAALAGRGDRVVGVDLAAEAVRRAAPQADPVSGDVTDPADCAAAVELAVTRYGRLDAVVACAGVELGGPAEELAPEVFRRVVEVNLTGVFLTVQAAGRQLIRQGDGGSIVLIGSVNSTVALAGQAAYAASKGGVLMLGRALAVDWARYGIRVNVLGPGVVDTPMSARSLADPERRAALMSRIPAGRPAAPAEIAAVAAFLTSPAASYVSGGYLPVDGGWLANG